jgi:hypothetical protein
VPADTVTVAASLNPLHALPVQSDDVICQVWLVQKTCSTSLSVVFDMEMNAESIGDVVETAAEENAEQQGDFGDFMANIEESMKHLMRETAKAPETALEHWQAFSSAVDWNETWIRGLVAFHLVLFALVILTRKNETAQTVLFSVVCLLTFMSERLNTYCAANWMQFSKQNYFDQHGVFAGIMYSGPLLVSSLVLLVSSTLRTRALTWSVV